MGDPAYLWIPDRAGTFADEVYDVAEQANIPLDLEQKLVIDVFMSHDSKGKWAARSAWVIGPRQSTGKTTGMLMPVNITRLWFFPPSNITWSANLSRTSRAVFLRIKEIIDGDYTFRRHVRTIHEGYGREEIILRNGAAMLFVARSRSGSRGLTVEYPVLDEGFALTDQHVGAMAPTRIAASNPQALGASSACLPDSGPLRDIVVRGRAGDDPSLAYVEWCAPGSWREPGCAAGRKCNHHRTTPGCSLDRRDYWRAANFSVPGRIPESMIVDMRNEMPAEEFGREILGWHSEETQITTPPVTVDMMAPWVDTASTCDGPVVMAVDVSVKRKRAAIAVAGYRADGIGHWELIRYGDGTDWVADEIKAIMSRTKLHRVKDGDSTVPGIFLDPGGPAGSLLPALKRKKINPYLMTMRQVAQSAGHFEDSTTQGTYRHRGQEDVENAARDAVRRPLGDGAWFFGRKASADQGGDVIPLTSVVMAWWGLHLAAPRRRARVASS